MLPIRAIIIYNSYVRSCKRSLFLHKEISSRKYISHVTCFNVFKYDISKDIILKTIICGKQLACIFSFNKTNLLNRYHCYFQLIDEETNAQNKQVILPSPQAGKWWNQYPNPGLSSTKPSVLIIMCHLVGNESLAYWRHPSTSLHRWNKKSPKCKCSYLPWQRAF